MRTCVLIPSSHARRSPTGRPIARSSAAGLPLDVQRIHRHDPLAELLEGARPPRERTSTPSRRLTSGASLATRLRPSITGFTSSTSYSRYAATRPGSRRARRGRPAPTRPPEAVVDGRRRGLDREAVVHVLGNLLARGVEQRKQADPAPRAPGTRSSRRPNASNPRTAFFAGSARSTRRTRISGRSSRSAARRARTPSAVGECIELGGVDRDRVRVRDALRVGAAAEQRLAALDERGAPPLGVEADAVAGEQPLVDRAHDRGREDGPVVRPDPRDVGEVRDSRVGARRPDERGHEVEVVVLDEERRTRNAVELLDRGRRERTGSPRRSRGARPAPRSASGSCL